ncbi:MAG TPA: DUF1461 domain-containing protein [Candidatus Nanoarchaeia archaeon]|nr:DUF1461 domain-containing protein [Candidatus Nanoarchaeia archaeon]
MVKSRSKKIILTIFSFFCFLFLILFSYQLVLLLVNQTENQAQTINYVSNRGELNLNYTALEISHLDDVKKVIQEADYLFYLSLVIVAGMILYYLKDRFKLKKLLLWGGITTTAVMGIILLWGIISFNSSFTIFHQIFFPQGNWQFPTDSLLIQTFPLEFFIEISLFIFILTLIEGIVFILLGIYLKDGPVERS